jgi:hypothetical protein
LAVPATYTPQAIALDGSGNLYIAQYGTSPANGIYEFAAGSNANSTPIRSISGDATLMPLSYAAGYDEPLENILIQVDAGGNIFVWTTGNSGMLVFSSSATGNVAPASVIVGLGYGTFFLK